GKSRSRHEGGSGLGLAIVKHIIDAHGQSITVKSSEGEGTTFAFTLQKAR
ncbi:MAG: sensor histidine kinase, partial [Flavobacteriales bacterium]|nr:sensor histidine kinase [Flavobacteriales bacterium]MCB0784469.1 sensor histidine kinase [Flavobacteriales bacterium]MCB0814277.1 sensor histidine kinase [Flavobacteriales bacterium]MCB0818650.1 sensor histidine kinase [Flavobacteriales bacterium]